MRLVKSTKNEFYFLILGFILGFIVGQVIPTYKAEAREARSVYLHKAHSTEKVASVEQGLMNVRCVELGKKAVEQIKEKVK